MDQATHNKIVSFIWGIADDVLRDLFNRGKYPDVILVCTENSIRPLASHGVSGVLALAVTQSCWQTEDLGRAAQPHWPDEPCEPPLGSATHSW
jgi:hypothetical protein